MKTVVKILISAIAFRGASGATYVGIQKWNSAQPVKSSKHQEDTLSGINGLSEGEVVTLPMLTGFHGEKVDLANLKEEYLLCVFIGSRCSGCTLDAELWKDLKDESTKRGVAFYLIDLGDELSDLERFSSAYNLDQLPLLFDRDQKVGSQLKVGFLPQYILFTRKGEVIHRWDGIRHYEKRTGYQQLIKFFQPHD